MIAAAINGPMFEMFAFKTFKTVVKSTNPKLSRQFSKSGELLKAKKLVTKVADSCKSLNYGWQKSIPDYHLFVILRKLPSFGDNPLIIHGNILFIKQ